MFNYNYPMSTPNYSLSDIAAASGIYTLGSCDDPTSTIYINENVSNKKLKKVLAHELTHAAIFSYNISLKPEEEELIADLVGTYGEEIINNTNLLFKQIKKIRE